MLSKLTNFEREEGVWVCQGYHGCAHHVEVFIVAPCMAEVSLKLRHVGGWLLWRAVTAIPRGDPSPGHVPAVDVRIVNWIQSCGHPSKDQI